MSSQPRPRVVAIGGGHGLAATLRACQPWAGCLTAVVSVADDGGSSGRLRHEIDGLPAPGDLRRCITTLAGAKHRTLAAALERRFRTGALAGHAAGNVVLAALVEETGDLESAAGVLSAALGVSATILPSTVDAVDLVGITPTGEVLGQVAVEAASGVARVRLEPTDPAVPVAALEALADADLVVLGPGSFYGSVVAAIAAPMMRTAVAASPGRRVLVHNLRTADTVAERVAALGRHGVIVDAVVVQSSTPGVVMIDAEAIQAIEVIEADVARHGGLAHDPLPLGAVLQGLCPSLRPSG